MLTDQQLQEGKAFLESGFTGDIIRYVGDSRSYIKYLLAEVERLQDIIISMQNYETETQKQLARDTEQIKELIIKNSSIESELYTLQEASRWIPVTERYEPTEAECKCNDNRFLVRCVYYKDQSLKTVGEAEYYGEWKINNAWNITHWRPLPVGPEQQDHPNKNEQPCAGKLLNYCGEQMIEMDVPQRQEGAEQDGQANKTNSKD